MHGSDVCVKSMPSLPSSQKTPPHTYFFSSFDEKKNTDPNTHVLNIGGNQRDEGRTCVISWEFGERKQTAVMVTKHEEKVILNNIEPCTVLSVSIRLILLQHVA